MTPERWRRVQEVFAQASERNPDSRPGFLDEVCRDDPELRVEVQSLLSALHGASPAFLESPAIDGLRRAWDTPRVLTAGTRLGPYEILGPLGAGGMGEVYRARDPRLSREVAIKVLAAGVASDPERLKRFEKEARAASALNHPNIVTIHDIGSADSMAYIAMELVEGSTLRELAAAGPLPARKLLQIAPQVAQGLAKAHDASIVHRDLKPENVMVTREGLVKILDFGLAKLSSRGSGSDEGSQLPTMSGTIPGVVLGTAGYMSPEQASGEAVDFRSDQFSFGSILYELATGRRAFHGKTVVDTMAAILNDEPEPVAFLNPRIPAPLRWIIERCLAKEPHQRYSATDDLARDLATLRDRFSETTTPAEWTGPPPIGRAGSARSRRLLAWGGVGLVLAIAAAVLQLFRRTPPPASPPELRLRQLTSNSIENPVHTAAISPDGNYLAYVDDRGMHIQLVGSDETRAVPPPDGLPSTDVDWEVGSWLPDSTRLFAVRRSTGADAGTGSRGASVWSVSVLGGPPRRVRDEAVVYGVSPDGARVAFGTNAGLLGEREIWTMDPSGAGARRLFAADESSSIAFLFWMPGGPRVCYVRTDASGASLVSREESGGPETTILTQPQTRPIDDLIVLPDSRLLYTKVTGERLAGSACDYWEITMNPRSGQVVGPERRVTRWPGFCPQGTSVTADGKHAAFLRRQGGLAASVGDLVAGGTGISNVRRLSLSSSSDVPGDWMPDGRSVIVVSDRNADRALYRQSLDGESVERLTPAGSGLGWPRVSADGKWICYLQDAADGKGKQVMRIPIGGGPPVPLFVARPGSWVLGTRSLDLSAVIAEPTADRKMILSAFDPAVGKPRELLQWDLDPVNDLWSVEVSPDGTRVATIRTPQSPIRILSLRGEPPLEIPLKGYHSLQAPFWNADGKSLYVSNGIQGGTQLLHVDLRGNAQVIWTDRGIDFSNAMPSPDGRHIALLRQISESNVWLMEGF